VNRWPLIGVFVVLLLAVIAAGSAQASSQQAWYWSKERAASVVQPWDAPKGCSFAIYQRGWIANCVAPLGDPDWCVGVGPRIISSTDDVYLYRKFNCNIGIRRWTTAKLKAVYQDLAEMACAKQQNDSAAYNSCLQAALQDRHSIATKAGLFPGTLGSRLDSASTLHESTARVQVTGRFTAVVSWLGKSWKMRIRPTG
jgi:hypothetical protein